MKPNTHAESNRVGRRRRSLWKSPALVAVLIVTLLLLASRSIDGWNWQPGAFILVGTLVFGLGFTYELVTRNRDAVAYRAAVGIAFAAVFLLMWGNFVQMADLNPAAAIYFGVPIVGIIGAAVARLRSNGMARALFVTALVQIMVLAGMMIMLITRNPQVTSWTAPELRGFVGNAIFATLFAGSAFLFRKAGRVESVPGSV